MEYAQHRRSRQTSRQARAAHGRADWRHGLPGRQRRHLPAQPLQAPQPRGHVLTAVTAGGTGFPVLRTIDCCLLCSAGAGFFYMDWGRIELEGGRHERFLVVASSWAFLVLRLLVGCFCFLCFRLRLVLAFPID